MFKSFHLDRDNGNQAKILMSFTASAPGGMSTLPLTFSTIRPKRYRRSRVKTGH